MDLGIDLYPAQEEAVLELLAGRHVILCTPTGSGKSLVAVALHFRSLIRGERSFYTSPIKALVSEKFFSLCDTFGADNVGMLTGDAAINRDAPIVCCTAEVLSNLALRQGAATPANSVVMDEFHFYADPDRGMAWQIPLLTLPGAQFLLMSATLGDTTEVEASLLDLTGIEVAVVTSEDRPVPLEFAYADDPIHESIDRLIQQDRAPVYVVNFSQREAAEQAQNLTSVKLCDKAERQAIAARLKGFAFDSPYGKDIQRYVRAGIGLHHAGILPKYRLLVERLAQQGLLKVISGTDTLGVGVNVPIRTVLFSKLCKYDGTKTRVLSVREFKQISGRAGRKGFDDRGWVVAQAPEHVIENRRLAAKAAGSGKKRFTRRQPPQRGYVPWNKKTFERLSGGKSEPLQSVFTIDQNVLLGMLQRTHDVPPKGGGYRAMIELIETSHEHAGSKRHLRRAAARLFRALRQAKIVEVAPLQGSRRGSEAFVSEGLQQEFSLHHTLSLYLIMALNYLDQRTDAYPLDVMSRVEAILEHPRAVLMQQLNKAKGDLIAELKADGVPYEERMEALEEVTWPRPDAHRIFETFNAFADRHPWVGAENIKPKSVARDLYERYCSFNDYVKEYGLERIEGVLLRYLSQAYKTLVQNVPESFHSDEVVEMSAWLRATIARVDSSLIEEWERMRAFGPGADELTEEELAAQKKRDITRDPRAFRARVRAELHHLTRTLAGADWEEAAALVCQDPQDPWTPERFEAALEPFVASYERVVFDHRARLSDKTTLVEIAPRLWEVSQILCDPEEDDIWAIRGVIDLRGETLIGDEPLVTVRAIGA